MAAVYTYAIAFPDMTREEIAILRGALASARVQARLTQSDAELDGNFVKFRRFRSKANLLGKLYRIVSDAETVAEDTEFVRGKV